MDVISRATLFNAQAIVTVLDTSETVKKAKEIHALSNSATEILGKGLTMGAFIGGMLKNVSDRSVIDIRCDGEIEKIIVCANQGAKVKGYVQNPQAGEDREVKDTRELVGKGTLRVIIDMGLKEPYGGTVELVDGSISADFMYYYLSSQQLNTAICLNVEQDGDNVKAGGIIIQPMPNCGENELFVLSDIARNFTNIANMLKDKTPHEIIDEHFGHFEIKYLADIMPKYECDCSRYATELAVRTLGKDESLKIIDEFGVIEVNCPFCKKTEVFTLQDIKEMYGI